MLEPRITRIAPMKFKADKTTIGLLDHTYLSELCLPGEAEIPPTATGGAQRGEREYLGINQF